MQSSFTDFSNYSNDLISEFEFHVVLMLCAWQCFQTNWMMTKICNFLQVPSHLKTMFVKVFYSRNTSGNRHKGSHMISSKYLGVKSFPNPSSIWNCHPLGKPSAISQALKAQSWFGCEVEGESSTKVHQTLFFYPCSRAYSFGFSSIFFFLFFLPFFHS